ncbi:cytochrome P450 4e3 [Drosophila pseudoobscura]|uniref:Cytochrome P450 4e3 n=1 Tax=Drosophila pseudoobscura pseudoobscura TaxID=46245 RepID=A0A6I8UJA0_DROPS|nr:cytochrome P450 4e3 [Drosophila pseudoobscura]
MWLAVLALLALPLLVLVYFELRASRRRRMLKVFNGPAPVPVLGNANRVGNTPAEILATIFDWWQEYGKDNFVFWIGYTPHLAVTNPKHLEYILNSQSLIQKSTIYELLHPWLGYGLLTSHGSKWHKHRKMITPSFHFNILQDFHEVMNENSTKFIAQLRRDAAGGSIIDFQDHAHYLTLDVICDTAMGVPINAMEHRNSAIVQAFKDMCLSVNMRAFHPFKRSNRIYSLSPEYAGYQRTLKTLQDFTYDIIEKRVETLQAGQNSSDSDSSSPRKKMAFLDTLLSSTVDGRPLTRQEIYEEVSTFMFEGHDTTTSGVAFAGYLLSRHPEAQQKMYQEQCNVMGSELDRDATFQEIAQMKYLDLFIKEAQRVYPSVPMIGRYADKDYMINGTLVPKGTTINLALVLLGYNDRIFKDPHHFRPERFEEEKPGPFEYVPFSAGPRNCIGQKFALLELKTVISKLVRSFEVLPAVDELLSTDGQLNTYLGLSPAEKQKREAGRHKYDPILSAVLTLKSDNGLHLRLKERRH